MARTPGQKWYGKPGREQGLRVTNVYATSWVLSGDTGSRDLSEDLPLWRYGQYYKTSADQFPRVLHRVEVAPGALSFKRWKSPESMTGGELWLFVMPSSQLVAAMSVDSSCELGDTVDLLEDTYYADVVVDGLPLESAVNELARRAGAQTQGMPRLLPERHQLVCAETPDNGDCDDVVQRVIYRTNLSYRKQFSAIRYPAEMNRRDGWLAAVGPYVSVIGGHPEFVESSIFASVVQAVAASARLREIRQAAYRDVRLFRGSGEARGDIGERRRVLEQIAAQLGDMELELSFSVEASADLSLLVPSLRAEGYHGALYESMGLADKATTTAKMLTRLERAVAAELTAIGSVERRADDERRLRWGVAVGFVSVVAIPAGLVLSFLGINASQVNPQVSMFSSRYLPMYLTVASIVLLAGLLAAGLYVRHRFAAAQAEDLAARTAWVSADDLPEALDAEVMPEKDMPPTLQESQTWRE